MRWDAMGRDSNPLLLAHGKPRSGHSQPINQRRSDSAASAHSQRRAGTSDAPEVPRFDQQIDGRLDQVLQQARQRPRQLFSILCYDLVRNREHCALVVTPHVVEDVICCVLGDESR